MYEGTRRAHDRPAPTWREKRASDTAAGAAPMRRGLPTSAIRRRRASGAGGVNRRSDRQHRSALTLPSVANQESHARSKQQSDDPRQLRPVRLAHCPVDPVVPPGAARLLSAWRCSRPGRNQRKTPLSLSQSSSPARDRHRDRSDRPPGRPRLVERSHGGRPAVCCCLTPEGVTAGPWLLWVRDG
jgi:hypothetical protein